MPWIPAPVGKSGPCTCSIYSLIEIFGIVDRSPFVSIIFLTCKLTAEATSVRLCGGILVAIPTAIPSLPFNRRFGIREGNTVGSCSESSKFDWKSTVFLSISSSMCLAIRSSRLSVYRIAAGGSPSIEPKLPCPSISG